MNRFFVRSLLVWMSLTTWFVLAIAPVSVYAQTTPARTTTCANGAVVPITLGVPIAGVSQVSGLGEYINTAYKYLASIVLVVAIVMVVYGGFIYLVGSAGISSIQRGKQIMKDAILGMVVVLAAYAILNTVNSNATRFTLSPQRVECVAYDAGNPNPTCESDIDCPSGRKCVQTSWSFSPQGNFSENITTGAQTGAVGGAVVGAGVGAIPGTILGAGSGAVIGFWQSFQGHKVCSDGSKDAPCNSTDDCKPNMELKCSSDWHLCLMTGANPNGHPCDDDSYCQSNNCSGESPKFCRGKVSQLTNPIYSSHAYSIPNDYACFTNNDCSESGGLCAGPVNSVRKFCSLDLTESSSGRVENGITLCFLNATAQVIPSACAGGIDTNGEPLNDYTCMVCPPTGTNRKWQVLNNATDPGRVRIGVCRRNSTDVNTVCAGS